MTALVNISHDKCKVCYACVRVCPVNAIQVRTDQVVPVIMPNRCIGCGSCIAACKPCAIEYLDSTESTRQLLKDKKRKSAVIVDPTIAAEFPDITDYRKFVSMLRALGFSYVNEVSFGADLIAAAYSSLIKDFRGKYYIMANDPVAIGYIEKFQPGLLPNLAPLVTPAIATAKVVREKYGKDLSIVYVGPLIATKKDEERGEGDGKLDAVLTFAELRDLFS
ncbi:MAG TPA: [Fe-Fe] hydrogenase large subunit C-terminal domain-containing protein, partial [Bacteroidales bacterium]|nr:[Fe-Fe] hydrogenase large subunit C-terminal domain-containing protein [Bacteroidales bacterium]